MKSEDWKEIRFFRPDEFACPCCGREDMNVELVRKLDILRDSLGIPIIITSGFRCPRHNAEIGGKPNSAHLRGLAADILIRTDRERYLIVNRLIDLGFRRIGIAKTFIHTDVDLSLPYPRIWVY